MKKIFLIGIMLLIGNLVFAQNNTKSDDEFLIVDESASPKGGMQMFYKYLSENIKYPIEAKNAKVQGKVFIQFVVNKKGEIEEAIVVRGIGFGCDEEALRVIKNAPAWNPGMHKDKPVKQRMVVPINFKYEEVVENPNTIKEFYKTE
jgi:periplasmic protein TonB